MQALVLRQSLEEGKNEYMMNNTQLTPHLQ